MSRSTQGKDLSMCRRIAESNGPIMSPSDDSLVKDHYCSNRNFLISFRIGSFDERLIHPHLINHWTAAALRKSVRELILSPCPPTIPTTCKLCCCIALSNSWQKAGICRGAPGENRSETNNSFSRGR